MSVSTVSLGPGTEIWLSCRFLCSAGCAAGTGPLGSLQNSEWASFGLTFSVSMGLGGFGSTNFETRVLENELFYGFGHESLKNRLQHSMIHQPSAKC